MEKMVFAFLRKCCSASDRELSERNKAFRKGHKKQKEKRKEGCSMESDFVKSVIFEENPFEDEEPAEERMFTLDGKEV